MNISDRQLRTFVSSLSSTAPKTIDDQNLIQLLGAVGDTTRQSQAAVRTALAGKSRQEQFDLVKVGLSRAETGDLATLLAKATAEGISLSPKAQNFIEALLGRAQLDLDLGPLVADVASLHGTVAPHATVSALNMSTAVMGRQHITETTELGTADASGALNAAMTPLPVSPGDRLRVNVRGANGSPDDWLTVTVQGADTTPAKLNIERIDLVDGGNGAIQISHNTARPLAEPGATLRLTNGRTSDVTDVKINDKGSFDAQSLAGVPGDRFDLAISDGVNNADFRTLAGSLRVGGQTTSGFDIEDPMPLKSDLLPNGASRFEKVRYLGDVVVDGVTFTDPRQGAIGNCYEPAGTAATAFAVPSALEKVVVEEVIDPATNAIDRKYTFTFYELDWRGNSTEHQETVDGDLWVRSFGGPAYGATLSTPRTPEQMELWYALREKARAKWKGGDQGYEVTGQGGIPGEVMSEVLGRPYEYESVNTRSADRVFGLIKTGLAQKAQGNLNWAMTAGTYGHAQEARYAGTGVYANHAYTIIDATEENGVKYVHLRNPWGQSEPAGNGANDGIFKLPLDKFVYLYQSVNYVDPNGSGPALTPRGPNQPLNSTTVAPSKDFDAAVGFMTTAQKALFALVNSTPETRAGLTPERVAQWLVENYAPLKEMSLESAMQALKDFDRLGQKIEAYKGTAAGDAFDSLREQLRGAIARERAHLQTARRD